MGVEADAAWHYPEPKEITNYRDDHKSLDMR